MRADRNRRVRFLVGVGIAGLRCAGKHVCDSWNCVGWLRFVSGKSAAHCIDSPSAHIGGSPMTSGLPGMHLNPLVPSRRTTGVSFSIFVDMRPSNSTGKRSRIGG